MPSTTVLITMVSSFLGFLLNTGIMLLILWRGRKTHHYLFAGILLLCANWDLGVFLIMIRNAQISELPLYGYLICLPAPFFIALFYHFTGAYLGHIRKKTTVLLWLICLGSLVFLLLGPAQIEGVYHYDWGNLFRPNRLMLQAFLPSFPLFWVSIGASVYLLAKAYRQETSPLRRRHMVYIMISFVAIGLALIKILALYNLDLPFLLPFGMAMNDLSIAVIAVAILKDRLFDITVVIKKGTIYSLLGALVLFLFSFFEHLLTTYFSNLVSGHSTLMHLISVAIAIAVLMPVKHRIEKRVENYFSAKQIKI